MRTPARTLTVLLLAATAAGCTMFQPMPFDEVGYLERAQTQESDVARVTVAVLSPEESRKAFGTDLAKQGIQPVWVEVENRRDEVLLFPLGAMDPEYFSPREAAHKARFFMSPQANEQMVEYFETHQMEMRIEPRETRGGFVFTNLDYGAKSIDVQLYGEGEEADFEFFVLVPGIQADYLRVDFEHLYEPTQWIVCDRPGLRSELCRLLPPTTTDKKGHKAGDPLNLVIVADRIGPAFASRGWDVTETMSAGSVWKTIGSSMFGGRYRYSPVSALYVAGRPQDVALQKARQSVDERNHLRLWLTPLQCEDKLVWAGQISRDIGVRIAFETFPPITHLIDPDVDEARLYLAQDLVLSGYVQAIGWLDGVGASTPEAPGRNLTGDPYFTDGKRLVIFLADEKVPLEDIRRLRWD